MKAILHKPIPPIVVRGTAAIVLGTATTVVIAWLLAVLVDGGQATGPRWQRGFKTDVASQLTPTPPQSPQQSGVHFASARRSHRWGTDIVELGLTWSEDVNRQPWGSPHALVKGTSFAADMKERFERGEAPTAWWRGDGWPLLAMSAEARWVSHDAISLSSRNVAGIPIDSTQVRAGDAVRILPLQPIWSGFVINTVLYASLWFALFSTGDMRSGLRRIRGRCVHCGYKLLPEQTRCSECGERVL